MYKKLLPQLALGPKTILFSNPCLDSAIPMVMVIAGTKQW